MLHVATAAGVLACLMRHFRASLASLPLLAQPLGALPLGTWDERSPLGAAELQQRAAAGSGGGGGGGGGDEGQRNERRVARLQTVRPWAPPFDQCRGRVGGARTAPQPGVALVVGWQWCVEAQPLGPPPRPARGPTLAAALPAQVRPDTPLTTALGALLESDISCLPVVDDSGRLLDIYARADITVLARVWAARTFFVVLFQKGALNLAAAGALVGGRGGGGGERSWRAASPPPPRRAMPTRGCSMKT